MFDTFCARAQNLQNKGWRLSLRKSDIGGILAEMCPYVWVCSHVTSWTKHTTMKSFPWFQIYCFQDFSFPMSTKLICAAWIMSSCVSYQQKPVSLWSANYKTDTTLLSAITFISKDFAFPVLALHAFLLHKSLNYKHKKLACTVSYQIGLPVEFCEGKIAAAHTTICGCKFLNWVTISISYYF